MTHTDPPAQDPRDDPRGATVAQLKNDIDSGRTGDKVAGFDPGLSPLGTDDEAGGAPYDPHKVAITRALELQGREPNPSPNAATPQLQPDARLKRDGGLLPALLGVGAAIGLGAILLAAL